MPHALVSSQERVLEVFWIERPHTPPSSPAPARAVTLDLAATPAAKRRVASPSVPAFPISAPVTTAQVPVVTDDVWEAVSSRALSDDASTIDQSAFRRDPLARRDTTFDPPPAPLEDAIQDRSFGGWMQRASKKQVCGALRAQLSRAPESTYTIIESMRRRGCKV